MAEEQQVYWVSQRNRRGQSSGSWYKTRKEAEEVCRRFNEGGLGFAGQENDLVKYPYRVNKSTRT